MEPDICSGISLVAAPTRSESVLGPSRLVMRVGACVGATRFCWKPCLRPSRGCIRSTSASATPPASDLGTTAPASPAARDLECTRVGKAPSEQSGERVFCRNADGKCRRCPPAALRAPPPRKTDAGCVRLSPGQEEGGGRCPGSSGRGLFDSPSIAAPQRDPPLHSLAVAADQPTPSLSLQSHKLYKLVQCKTRACRAKDAAQRLVIVLFNY